jgi:hypothetical protein
MHPVSFLNFFQKEKYNENENIYYKWKKNDPTILILTKYSEHVPE